MVQTKQEESRRYYLKNKDKIRARQKIWEKSNPLKMREKWLKATYNMTLEQYDVMMYLQDGVCALCRTPCRARKNLSVDHNHKCCPGYKSCGKCIRGLICNACNNGLGRFNDNKEILTRAIRYLEFYDEVS